LVWSPQRLPKRKRKKAPEATIVPVLKTRQRDHVGMAGWGLSTVEEKTLVHVIVIAVIALVAYFIWWKRRL
jgi:hypothetical protein